MWESRELKHNYVGTEHILLGLLREDSGATAQVLMNLGLRLDKVRAETLAFLGQPAEDEGRHEFSPQSRLPWVKHCTKPAGKPSPRQMLC